MGKEKGEDGLFRVSTVLLALWNFGMYWVGLAFCIAQAGNMQGGLSVILFAFPIVFLWFISPLLVPGIEALLLLVVIIGYRMAGPEKREKGNRRFYFALLFSIIPVVVCFMMCASNWKPEYLFYF